MDKSNHDKMELIKETRRIRTPGLSQTQLMKEYGKWQNSGIITYDEVVKERGYTGPRKTAESLARHVPMKDRWNFRLLDVGAGTGLVGQELLKREFGSIDALDPSADLVKSAENKNVYRHVYRCFMTGAETYGLANDHYDGLISCGCFMENHLPVESLNEMIRVVKPGGLIVLTTRYKYLDTVEAYKDKLEPFMSALEKRRMWTLKAREIFPKYYLEDEGIVWTFLKA